MRKTISCVIIFFSCFIFMFFAQEEDDTILEKVAVVNVEVPVRVFYKGKPVKDLKRSDFKIYEDGKLQNINAFFKIRKKINIQNYELSAEKREKTVYPSRYFILIFNLIDYNRNLKKGLDFTFNHILRENDQLLVIVSDKNLYFNNLSKKEKILKQITKLLEEKGKTKKNKMIELFNRIDREIRILKTLSSERESELSKDTNVFVKFIGQYYFIWKHFKREYLRQDIDNYYYFARHLEKIKKEKWVIHFYQEVQFPQIKLTSSFLTGSIREKEKRRLEMILDKINFELKAETKFPADEVSKLFYKVNATFHMILIPTRINIPHEDMEFKSVSTALENCFREITKKTGGALVSSADLVTALNTISEKEDIYYMLTYRPENPKKTGKIEVEVIGKKYNYKVHYDKNIRAKYIRDYLKKKKLENPEIIIKKIHFKDRKLYLEVQDFLLKGLKKETYGQVDLWVRVENNDGEILYDKHKKLNPSNETASIQVDFNWLKQGRYYFFVETSDKLTGKSYTDYIQAEISETKTKLKRVEFNEEEVVKPKKEFTEDSIIKNKELEKYLKGAAEYCERLKKRAFHFICKEKVSITIKELNLKAKYTHWKGAPRSKFWNIRQHTNRYLFDYQLINNKGQITEQRRLIIRNSINDKKVSVKNLVSSFLSEKAIFGPHTMLSKKRQNKFKYEILKTKRNKNQRIVVIKVIPKKEEEVFFSSGEVWIDTNDFSVREIKVTPRYIEGYEKLIQKAKFLKTKLFLNCEIQYNQDYRGLYFPTEVRIIETYKGGPIIGRSVGIKGFERSKTTFKYKDYKFFNVNTDIQY